MDYEDWIDDGEAILRDNEDSDNSDEEVQQKKVREHVTIVPGHLASPIYAVEINMIIEDMRSGDKSKMGCYRHRKIISCLTAIQETIGAKVISVYDIAKDPLKYLTDWAHKATLDNSKLKKDFDLCIASTENTSIHKAHFLTPVMDSVHDRSSILKLINDRFNKITTSLEQLYPEYVAMKKAEFIKDEICFKEIKSGDFVSIRGLHAERDLSYLVDGKNIVLIPTNLLLCALDKMQCEFGLIMAWKLSDINEKYPGRSIEGKGKELMVEMKRLREQMGQDFFAFIGCWEALVVGWTIGSRDDLGCLDLFATQFKEMTSLLTKHGVSTSVMRKLVPEDRSNDSVLMGLELVGMTKIFGYPTLIIEKLLDQIRDHGTANKHEIDPELIKELSAVARRDFTFQYKKKKGHYPPVASCPKELKWLQKNKHFQSKYNKRYDLWSQVKFQKCLDFNYCQDASELVKDSSTATNTSAWSDMYDRCAFYMRYHKGYPRHCKGEKIYTNRTIEHYLQADEDEVRKLVTERDKGVINPEDMICVECGKECEIKIDSGRAFTKQTPPQRLIQTVMELNIATGIFPFVPQQSMIDGEIRNTRRILDQVKHLQSGHQFISLDLKKWCLFQRHESTSFIGEMYDELFGFSQLYKTSHLFFNSSHIFTNNRLSPPDFDHMGRPIPGPLYMNNFIGGMEGMQQKKWTHITECLIQLTLEKSGLAGEIMGQGDNQVILLKLDKNEPSSDLKRTNFLIALDANFKKIHHELKEKETWYSSHLHEYSKQRVYKGIAVSNATKKACRIMPDINDGLFSITSSCATINTITEGIARADYNADVAFTINQFMMTNYLLRKKILQCGYGKTNDTESVLKARAMLMCPADFGGLPLSSYYTHTVRGNDDKVTLWISLAQALRKIDPGLYNATLSLWQELRTPSQDPMAMKRLIEDVYAISVSTLPSSEREIREMTRRYLISGAVTNPSITKLYQQNVSKSYDDLIKSLSTMRPMFPQLAHEILKNSNAGTLLQLQNKLTSTKTIEKIVNSQSQGLTLIQLIQKQNMDITRILKARSIHKPLGVYYNLIEREACPCKIADYLRTQGWGIPIVGVTKPVYQHQARVYSYDNFPREWVNKGITIRLGDEIVRSPRDCYKKYGKMNPYIGSQTKEKIKKSTLSVVEKTSYVKSLLRLGKLRSWCGHLNAPHLMALIGSLMEEKRSLISNIPEGVTDLQDLCASITSGNPYHRMKSEIDHDTAMVNCLPSITGHFEHDSNTFKGLTIGGKDYSVFFQLNYISDITCLAILGIMIDQQQPQYIMVFPCDYCSGECPSPTIDLLGPAVSIPVYPKGVSEEIELKPILTLDESKQAMATKVGRDFAKNIDRNFTLHHDKGVGEHSSKDYESFVVSLNDLRVLDLRTVIDVAFLHSSHVKSLYLHNKPALRCLNEDKSFVYFAERIIQAGLLELLINIMDLKLINHSAVTTFIGLSMAISAAVVPYIKRNRSAALRGVFISFKDDLDSYEHLDATRFCYRILSDLRALDSRSEGFIKNVLMKNRPIIARMKMSPGSKRLPIESSDAITVWRSFDRSQLQQQVFIPIGSCGYSTKRLFPHDEVSTYHLGRATCQNIKPLAYMKCLSFLARPSGSISSAQNKFLELIMRMGMLEVLGSATNGSIYCLAEGSGGTLDCLMKLIPNANKVFYNTLMLPGISNRDVPSCVLPPAVVASRSDQSKLSGLVDLAMGTTDILSDIFLSKLDRCMRDDPPLIVTIDAESPNRSNNFMFVEKTVCHILRHSPVMVICKIFFLLDFEDQITSAISEASSDYECFFYKPISSNPTGPEVYLAVIRKDSITPDCGRNKANWAVSKAYLGKTMPMSYELLSKYCQVAQQIALFIQSITYQVMPTRYNSMIPELCCSILCPRLYIMIVEAIFDLHNHSEERGILVTIRRKGTSFKIHSLLQEFVFLTTYLSKKKATISDMIANLFRVNLNKDLVKEWRRNPSTSYLTCSASGGNLLQEWYDVRMYLREASLGRPCRQQCTIKNRPEITRDHLCNRLVADMRMVGIVENDNVFEKIFKVVNKRN